MVAGTVTVEIQPAVATTIDTRVTALRVSANDHWNFVPLANGQQIMIIHVEEA
ncbi:hypothetical protein GQ473_00185 [archaeon]|nr:hypothetical protein [archaeon]